MFLKKSELVTYSGPMANGDFGKEDISEYTMEQFFKTVNRETECNYTSTKIYKTGISEGILWGGNLASIVSLCGIDFVPDEGFIFFAEDLNEPVYKIDKMITQLLNIAKFKDNIRGIILGDFLESGYPEQLDMFFKDLGEDLDIPVLGGYKITHNSDKITLPYGADAAIVSDTLVF
jgi:muramoyltetrapeptide carboxypeptidase